MIITKKVVTMIKVYENINAIIKAKGFTKKEFAESLINLHPNVNRNSETPTLPTIYGYLNGRINIPIDLIPFIAEALDVTEQELFDTSLKTRKKCFKYFLQNASKEELEYFHNFINSQIHNNININYGQVVMNTPIFNEKVEKLTQLLKYAPADFMDKILARLEEYKKLQDLDI